MITPIAWAEGLAAVAGPLSRGFELAAFLVFAVSSVALAVIDVATLRLPRRLVQVAFAFAALLLIAAAVSGGDWSRAGRALLCAALLFATYLALAVTAPAAVGGGDVRLAALIGLVLGWVGWGALVVGAFAGFVLGGLWAIGLLWLRGRARGAHMPYGPFMLAGAWLGVFAGEAVARCALGSPA